MAARKAQHEFRAIQLKLIELWYGTTSTALLTQLKKRGWHPRLGGGAHADTIMDRIVQGVAPKPPRSDFAHALEHEVCGTPLPCDFLEDLSKRANETRVEVGGDEPHAAAPHGRTTLRKAIHEPYDTQRSLSRHKRDNTRVRRRVGH